jgi:uncharacterized surface protein with fasciclin (FAS1) repeats
MSIFVNLQKRQIRIVRFNPFRRIHMLRRSLLILTGIAAATTVLTACGSSDDHVVAPAKNIVELAQATPDLSILVEAVVAAGLAGTLSGAGPFTVFAPTNAAFVALLGELGVTKEALLANKTLLTAVLTYHVLGSKVESTQIPLGAAIKTVQGANLTINSAGMGLAITDARGRKANITTANIQASNGVVHLIDKVILPPA